MNRLKALNLKKKHFLMLLMVILSLSFWSCLAHHRSSSPYAQAIVTAGGDIVPIAAFHQQLDSVVHDILFHDELDNIILFIHGRGKHPEKAFRQHLLTDLEADYSARVLMFHWSAWDGPFGFPEDQARAAAPDLIEVLSQLEDYQREHEDRLSSIRFTLLTQSMGSIVLEASAQQQGPQRLPGQFDTIVLSAPASASQGHESWIKHLPIAKQTSIVIHRHDPVLAAAEFHTKQGCLGKQLPQDPNGIAKHVFYLDISQAWVAHRYYLHHYQHFSPKLRDYYDQVLNGQPAQLDTTHGFRTLSSPNVFHLFHKRHSQYRGGEAKRYL